MGTDLSSDCSTHCGPRPVTKSLKWPSLFKRLGTPGLGQYVFFYIFLVNKNHNKCILIGLHKCYSVYKIGDRFMAFLLVIAAICDFNHDCDIAVDISDTFDTIWNHSHLYSDQCYKNALITV